MIVIGVDVHKQSVRAVAVDEAGRMLNERTVAVGVDRPRFGGHAVTRLLSVLSSFSSSRIRRVTGSPVLSGA